MLLNDVNYWLNIRILLIIFSIRIISDLLKLFPPYLNPIIICYMLHTRIRTHSHIPSHICSNTLLGMRILYGDILFSHLYLVFIYFQLVCVLPFLTHYWKHPYRFSYPPANMCVKMCSYFRYVRSFFRLLKENLQNGKQHNI